MLMPQPHVRERRPSLQQPPHSLSWELWVREQIIFPELLPLAILHVDVNCKIGRHSGSVVIELSHCSWERSQGGSTDPPPRATPGGCILKCALRPRPSPVRFSTALSVRLNKNIKQLH